MKYFLHHFKDYSLLTLFIVPLMLGTSNVFADSLNVDKDDPGCDDGTGTPYCTIQAAIDAATASDDIQISAATYTENIVLDGTTLTLQGAGQTQTIIDGTDTDTVIKVMNAADVDIMALTVKNGTAAEGGGIHIDATSEATVEDCLITENHSTTRGGGILVDMGTLLMTQSTVHKNTSDDECSGICAAGTVDIDDSTISENEVLGSGFGAGGLGFLIGDLNITDTTIRDNEIASGFGAGVLTSGTFSMEGSLVAGNISRGNDLANDGGGGIVIFGGLTTADIRNTTISGNQTDAHGGGIGNGGSLTLNNVTIANNTADADEMSGGDGGGIFNEDATGTTTLRNSLVADNVDSTSDPDCLGTLTSSGFNLIETVSAGCTFATTTGDITGEDPLLDDLADNSGPTETHALKDGSPAIDKGSCTDSDDFDVFEDQRGSERPAGDDCDIGAYELSVCGDDFIGADEECEDGNTIDTDDCTNQCKFNICGDGSVLEDFEDCDDGNTDDGDGCDSTCVLEEGILGAASGCSLVIESKTQFNSIAFVLVLLSITVLVIYTIKERPHVSHNR